MLTETFSVPWRVAGEMGGLLTYTGGGTTCHGATPFVVKLISRTKV